MRLYALVTNSKMMCGRGEGRHWRASIGMLLYFALLASHALALESSPSSLQGSYLRSVAFTLAASQQQHIGLYIDTQRCSIVPQPVRGTLVHFMESDMTQSQ